MWATIWPVLSTIASYYVHNKRQWGHAKVTLQARLAPLPQKEDSRLGAQCDRRGEYDASIFPYKGGRVCALYVSPGGRAYRLRRPPQRVSAEPGGGTNGFHA